MSGKKGKGKKTAGKDKNKAKYQSTNSIKTSPDYGGNIYQIFGGTNTFPPVVSPPNDTGTPKINVPLNGKFWKPILIFCSVFLIFSVAIFIMPSGDIRIISGIVPIMILSIICFRVQEFSKNSYGYLYFLVAGVIILAIAYRKKEPADYLDWANQRIKKGMGIDLDSTKKLDTVINPFDTSQGLHPTPKSSDSFKNRLPIRQKAL